MQTLLGHVGKKLKKNVQLSLKLVRDTKKSKKEFYKDASSKRRFIGSVVCSWMGDTSSLMANIEKAGYHHFSINLHRWNLLLDLCACRCGFRRERQSAVGKLSGDCSKKLQVFKLLRPDGTSQRVLKELTDVIGGTLAWPSSVKNCGFQWEFSNWWEKINIETVFIKGKRDT